MNRQAQSSGTRPAGACTRGIFLPSMVWATDTAAAQRERRRLLRVRKRLAALVEAGAALDSCATWYVMAEAALGQLDRDLDALFDWFDDARNERTQLKHVEPPRRRKDR